jgi:hypothetical protein
MNKSKEHESNLSTESFSFDEPEWFFGTAAREATSSQSERLSQRKVRPGSW